MVKTSLKVRPSITVVTVTLVEPYSVPSVMDRAPRVIFRKSETSAVTVHIFGLSTFTDTSLTFRAAIYIKLRTFGFSSS